jgi:methionine biosynthesis protein MetW
MPQLALIESAEPDFDAPVARADHAAIARLVRPKAKVLEIGCGDGALLNLLARERGAKVRGLELNQHHVNTCVSHGLSVVQGDADRELSVFPSGGFDYVILSRTLQTLKQPRAALQHAARIGGHVIVSIANAAYWRSRVALMTKGKVRGPKWDATDILHPSSVRDFVDMARDLGLTLERGVPISNGHAGAPFAKTLWRANWFAEDVVFQVAR